LEGLRSKIEGLEVGLKDLSRELFSLQTAYNADIKALNQRIEHTQIAFLVMVVVMVIAIALTWRK